MIHWTHKWYPTKVEQGTEGPYDQPSEYWPRVTVILFLCSARGCVESKVKKLEGHWTLEEVIGDVSEGRQ